MTKREIAKLVYSNTNLSQVQSQTAVQATVDSLTRVLLKYGRVELRGFGVFTVQTRAGRKARNPRTGEDVWVEEHDTVIFKPSKHVKESLEAKRLRKAKAAANRESKAAKKASASSSKTEPTTAVKSSAKPKAKKTAVKKSTKK